MRALTLVMLLSGCADMAAVETSEQTQPIFGGRSESGFQAIGALTLELPEHGYVGSFCTGTLIDARWVLTAAHCATGPAQIDPAAGPTDILFYVGPDARPPAQAQRPAGGGMYAVARAHIHPGYREGSFGLDDIALLELVAPVEGVAPVQLHQGPAVPGRTLMYVGFGVSDGVARSGGGVKRSTSLLVDRVRMTTYSSAHEGSGVCFGDSGGPGLVAMAGGYEVVGVNSKAAGNQRAGECALGSLQTRVDAYRTWIDSVMGRGGSCLQDPGRCACPAACSADGVCDNLACGSGSGCAEVAECSASCESDAFCAVDCYADGHPDARRAFDALLVCAGERCMDVADQSACLQARCAGEVTGCFEMVPPPPAPSGDGTCAEVLDCVGTCEEETCYRACTERGTAIANAQFDALLGCAADRCADRADDAAAYTACSYDACATEWTTCIPADGCRLAGGDCSAETACLEAPWGGRYCFASAGRGAGEACAPDGLDCGDGLVCDGAGACASACAQDVDCGPGAACSPVEVQGASSGMCVAGSGAPESASPSPGQDDPEAAPACTPLPEVCNGRDDNCDGVTDEGCARMTRTAKVVGEHVSSCSATGDGGAWWLALLLLAVRQRRSRRSC